MFKDRPRDEEMKTYTTNENKSEWGEGPWVDEPDKVVWVDPATNLDCMIHRNQVGAWCGYVGVPNTHPDYGKEYDNVDVEVHGSLTYSNKCQTQATEEHGICHVPEPGREHDIWWLGFDCAHAFDLAPQMEAHTRKMYEPGGPLADRKEEHDRIMEGDHLLPRTTYKDMHYAMHEVENLAIQINERDK